MLKIIYTEKGKAYSDFNLIENAQFIIDQYHNKIEQNNRDITIEISTYNIILALRLLVSRGKLQYDELCIIFNEHEIYLNSYFELSKWPVDFADWEQKFLRELIGCKIGRKFKNDKEIINHGMENKH